MTTDRSTRGECMLRRIAVAMLLLAGVAVPPPAAAQEAIGRVLTAVGEVTAVRAGATARSLDRGDPVYEGDEIRTGEPGHAQVRFTDGGLFALEADTRFAVDRYRDDDAGGSALMRFLQGALRTITGTIGGDQDDVYQLETPTATIGVRGTGYALNFCADECAQRLGTDAGMFGRVDEGGIVVQAPTGPVEFGRGDYFFISLDGIARPIVRPPQGILDGGVAAAARGAARRIAAGEVTPQQVAERARDLIDDPNAARLFDTIFESAERLVTDDPTLTGSTPATGTTGTRGAVAAAAGVSSLTFNEIGAFAESGPFLLDADGRLVEAEFSSGLVVGKETATLLDAGSSTALGVDWGRWQGTLLVDDGIQVVPSEDNSNLAFAVTDNITSPTALGALGGSLDYALVGGPRAFDTDGNLWAVDALSLSVDFAAADDPIGINRFELSPEAGGATLAVTEVFSSDLDLDGNGLALAGGSATGDVAASLVGRFVGANGEGIVASFVVNEIDTDTGQPLTEISGLKVLQR